MIELMAFRRLTYEFVVRCDSPSMRSYISHVLARFAVPAAADGATIYEIRDLGSSSTSSRYRLRIDGRWVLGSGDPAHVLDDLFSRVNMGTMEATDGQILIHAGAVVAPGGAGVLLPAPSGSGKTTLVAGLVRAGFGYLSDEAAVLDPLTGVLHPYPVHLSLKTASRDWFPEAKPDIADLAFSGLTWHVDPDAIRAAAVAAPCEVGFVASHRYTPGAKTEIERLTPAEACVELVRNLMLGRRDATRSLDLLARISRASRSYRLTHGDLGEAVEAIVGLTRA